MATRLSTASRNAAANAVVDQLDSGGTLRIYTGSQPASAEDSPTGDLLAEITLPSPTFGAASNGVATANSIDPGEGEDDGTAGWFRVVDDNGDTVLDGSAGTSGTDMILNTATISTGVGFEIVSWTVTMPAG